MVQILADFASAEGEVPFDFLLFLLPLMFPFFSGLCMKLKSFNAFLFEALQFSSRLKDVLLRVLPILGSVRDAHRPIFANGIFF